MKLSAMASDLPRPFVKTDPKALAADILNALRYRVGKDASVATQHDWLAAAIKVVRDRIVDQWIESTKEAYENHKKRVYYLSLEFLMGRLMRDAFSNIGLMDDMREALGSLGVDIDMIAALEPDAALGNGGLGRLPPASWRAWRRSACPATATASATSTACSARRFTTAGRWNCPRRGSTTATPGNSSAASAPSRSASAARWNPSPTRAGRLERHVWQPQERVTAVAYDTPVVGWRGARVNTLRLWSGFPVDPILLDAFNAGDHIGALAESNKADALSRVLYPADSSAEGRSSACARSTSSPQLRCRTSCSDT
jgi:starch phosphorylase